MPGPDRMVVPSRKPSVRRVFFFALQALVGAEGITFVSVGAVQFLAAAGGYPPPLFASTVLFALAAALFYTAIALRGRGSTPFFATLVASLFGILIIVSLAGADAARAAAIGLAIAVVVALTLLR